MTMLFKRLICGDRGFVSAAVKPALILVGAAFLTFGAPYGKALAQNNLPTLPPPAPSAADPSASALPQAPGTSRDPGMAIEGSGGEQSAYPPALPVKEFRSRSESEIRSEAFDAALGGLLPLKPDEIRKLLEYFDKTRQSVEVPVHPYPEPEVVVKTLALDPGVTPPVIKVGTGHVTTLNILDMSGEPWPIRDMSWAGNFEIVQPESGGNVVRITPMSEYAYGNISITLVDFNTPVTFTIQTARDKIHYRFDARIPAYGPQAQTPIIEGHSQSAAGDGTLGDILDGVAPPKAERLVVNGVDGRTTAYLFGEKTYVRTPLTLLSPGWESSVSSADGMNVYALRNAPVILLSDNGEVVRARLNRKNESDDGSK